MAVRNRDDRRGFTLVELLVVIGIIAVLIGILIPVIGKVRISGYVADSKNWLSQLQGAIDRYHTDFRAYPGPLSYQQVHDQRSPIPPVDAIGTVGTAAGYDLGTVGTFTTAQITGTENLVLGLLGGLKPNTAAANPPIVYDPTTIGLGPMTLNPSSSTAKRYPPYLDAINLSWQTINGLKTGHFFDDATSPGGSPVGAVDTIVPEFVDRFPQPMPLLYLRCRIGVSPITPGSGTFSPSVNSVITYDPGTNPVRGGPYDLSQIIGYTGGNGTLNIGVGRTIKSGDYVPAATSGFPQGLSTVTVSTSSCASLDKSDATNYRYPYDAFAYFLSSNFKGIAADTTNYPKTPLYPRQKDGYILISPGADRTYGTNDDICSFGEVNP